MSVLKTFIRGIWMLKNILLTKKGLNWKMILKKEPKKSLVNLKKLSVAHF